MGWMRLTLINLMKSIHINSNKNPPANLKGNNRSTQIKNILSWKFWYGRDNHVHQHKNNLKTCLKERKLQFQLKDKTVITVSTDGMQRISLEIALKKLVVFLWNSIKHAKKKKKKRAGSVKEEIKPIKSIKKGHVTF